MTLILLLILDRRVVDWDSLIIFAYSSFEQISSGNNLITGTIPTDLGKIMTGKTLGECFRCAILDVCRSIDSIGGVYISFSQIFFFFGNIVFCLRFQF